MHFVPRAFSLTVVATAFVTLAAPDGMAQMACTASWSSGCISNPCTYDNVPSCEDICKTSCKGEAKPGSTPTDSCNNGMFCEVPQARFDRSCSCIKNCDGPGASCTLDSQCCEPLVCNQIMGSCSDNPSPILINLRNGSVNYHLTSAGDGVIFDINADGAPDRVAWTRAGSDVGFLAFDRNSNGRIDDGEELFGSATPLTNGHRARHGFEALRDIDGTNDGWVDARDPVFPRLRIWVDRNHNGVSERTELYTLRQAGITTLFTTYRDGRRSDEHGNAYRYVGKALIVQGGHEIPRAMIDVRFVLER